MIVGCDEKGIKKAVEILKKDVAVIPTDTLYALSSYIFNEKAVKKVYILKGRTDPLPVGVCSLEMMEEIAVVGEKAKKLVEKFMPGGLTIILPKKRVPDYVSKSGVAVRIPNCEIALKIIEKVGPITLTSANIHGRENPVTVDVSISHFGEKVPLYMNCGKLGGKASTIVDLRGGEIKVIREGPISSDYIKRVLYD